MMERRIVLFGGSGFVGRHLALRLAAEGWTVRIASRQPRQEETAAARGRIVSVTADLGEEDQVRRAVIPNPDDPPSLAPFHVADRQGQPGRWHTLQPDLV
jgi:nucleoside-diphosphate-sugar epimerase